MQSFWDLLSTSREECGHLLFERYMPAKLLAMMQTTYSFMDCGKRFHL